MTAWKFNCKTRYYSMVIVHSLMIAVVWHSCCCYLKTFDRKFSSGPFSQKGDKSVERNGKKNEGTHRLATVLSNRCCLSSLFVCFVHTLHKRPFYHTVMFAYSISTWFFNAFLVAKISVLWLPLWKSFQVQLFSWPFCHYYSTLKSCNFHLVNSFDSAVKVASN